MVLVKEFVSVDKKVYQVFEDSTDPDLKKIQILVKRVLLEEIESV